MVEQLTCNQQVPSSTLGGGTILKGGTSMLVPFFIFPKLPSVSTALELEAVKAHQPITWNKITQNEN